MADLFTRTEVAFGGAMHAQNGIISNKFLTGVLMQNIRLNYSQAVSRIYELGRAGQKTRVFYISGRSQGQIDAAHVVGPGFQMAIFYEKFGDVCNAPDNNLDLVLGPNICAANGANVQVTYKAKYCVLTTVGLSVAAQDFVVNENSSIMFSALEFIQSPSAVSAPSAKALAAGQPFAGAPVGIPVGNLFNGPVGGVANGSPLAQPSAASVGLGG